MQQISKNEQIREFLEAFRKAIEVVARLRGPNGCPWDREQNHLTLRPYLIEEAYEVLDVLDRYNQTQDQKTIAKQLSKDKPVPADGYFEKKDQKNLCEELGDLLLQVLLHAQLCWERGEFNIGDVARNLSDKLIRRHPHVFGEVDAKDSDEVLQNWESLKKKEGKNSLLEGLPKNLPSLQRAARIGEKAQRVKFDWKDWKGALEKVEEEFAELKEAIASGQVSEMEHELGDLFFSLCNLSRHLKLQPEDAHRKAISRFEKRFEKVETYFKHTGKDITDASEAELEQAWELAKTTE